MQGLQLTEEETRALLDGTMPTHWLITAYKLIQDCVSAISHHILSHAAMEYTWKPNSHVTALDDMQVEIERFQKCFDRCVFMVLHESPTTRMATPDDWRKTCQDNWRRLFDIGVTMVFANTIKIIRQGIAELQAPPRASGPTVKPQVFDYLQSNFESVRLELTKVWEALISDCGSVIIRLTAGLHSNHFRDLLAAACVVVTLTIFVVVLMAFKCFGKEFQSFTIAPEKLLLILIGSILAMTRIPDLIRSVLKALKSGATGT